jgi:hypothetical protein
LATRIFLFLSVLVWLPYGIYCFLQPGALAESAGVAFTSDTGNVEIRAMYGGLQAAIGALALAGLLRPALARTAMVALLALALGLGGSRVLAAVMVGDWSQYTIGALIFEWITVGAAAVLLRRTQAQPA